MPGSRPLAQHRLELPEPEKEVLGLAPDRRCAGQHRDRVDEVGGRVLRAADLAAVAVLIRRAATRTGAADVAVGQEHPGLFVERLPDRFAADMAVRDELSVDFPGELAALARVRRVEI